MTASDIVSIRRKVIVKKLHSMGKKGQGSDPVAMIIGLFSVLIIAYVAIALLSLTSSMTTGNVCKDYQNQITQLNGQIAGLNSQLAETNSQLQTCSAEYNNLVEQNITKKDFEDIKGYFNITQIQINTINSRLDQINQNYYSTQNLLVNQYNFSVALNFVLALEFLSFTFLKNEFAVVAIEWVNKKKKARKKKKDEER